MRKLFLLLFLLSSLACFVIYPSDYIAFAKSGIDVCLYTIIPALLPFFIVSGLLVSSNLLQPLIRFLTPLARRLTGLSGSIFFIYLASSLSGYPTGAKLTCDLLKNNQITKSESGRYVLFTSVTGPAFMIFVASSLINLPAAFVYIISSHHLAMILIIIIYNLIFKKHHYQHDSKKNDVVASNIDFSSLINTAVLGAVKTLSLICGLVIFFFTLTGIIDKIGILGFLDANQNNRALKQIVFGMIEMTLGCIKVSETNISIVQKISILHIPLHLNTVTGNT
jgi:sporulation integral membrane protein YlbJ